jgi:IS5 family transposase
MIKTWRERCEEHPDHEGIVTERMIRNRMQEEIDELRQAIAEAEDAVAAQREWVPEALRLADALDAEFVQGRISNSTGRESAVELRRLALKQWVGLTDDEMEALFLNEDGVRFARYIEAKLREKNKW